MGAETEFEIGTPVVLERGRVSVTAAPLAAGVDGAMRVAVGVPVGNRVEVRIAVLVRTGVRVSVAVKEAVRVGVTVEVREAVRVGVTVAVLEMMADVVPVMVMRRVKVTVTVAVMVREVLAVGEAEETVAVAVTCARAAGVKPRTPRTSTITKPMAFAAPLPVLVEFFTTEL